MKKSSFAPLAIFAFTMLFLAGCTPSNSSDEAIITRCQSYCADREAKDPYFSDETACNVACVEQAKIDLQ